MLHRPQMRSWYKAVAALALAAGSSFAQGGNSSTIVVAADGSGQFRTVQEAVDAAPDHATAPVTIRIKPGIYREHITVPQAKPFLHLVGEDAKTTVLTFNLYASIPGEDGKPIGTFKTSSTTIAADDFYAENLTFENSAGNVGQAVALAVFGDRARFRNCRFLGWQDTLLAQSGRQYFENAYIEGAVDFIFGGATAWFENCHIHASGNGYITAASTPKDQPFGYVFSGCRITGATGVKTYLGRPWRDYAYVAYLGTEMNDVVRPTGWDNWKNPARESTSRYFESGSSGAGANPSARVAWAHALARDDAARLQRQTVLSGKDQWNVATGTFVRAQWTIPADARARMEMPNATNGEIVWLEGRMLAHGSARFEPMAGKNALDLQNPAMFYDVRNRTYIISWASTIDSNYFQSYQEPEEDNPRLWFTTTKDFVSFTPAQVLFEPGYAVRYGMIVRDGERFALLHEDSRRDVQKLRVSFSNSPTGPWGAESDPLGEGFHERVRIALAGDSTVAEGGGWGPGFRASFGPDVEVLNFARNGRSSKSFRAEGLWDDVLKAKANYVLIQFGHNDVPGKAAETDADTEFRANLLRFAQEVRAYGGAPVLVSSIVRRKLTAEGRVQPDSLDPYVDSIRKLAAETEILFVDMNEATRRQCESMGPAGCATLNAVAANGDPDTTHLSALGKREVGKIAAREFVRTLLPGQPNADPKTLTSNILLPLNQQSSTFAMTEPDQPRRPAIVLVGDSTVHNGLGAGAGGLWGWGDLLQNELSGQKRQVVNRAISGLSSRTYITLGHWERTLELLRAGDTLLLQFGHNDASPVNDPTRARGSIAGQGEDTSSVVNHMTGKPETVHTYGWYMRKMITEARTTGVRVIVCSPVPRNSWQNGVLQGASNYTALARQVAENQRVPFLDLNALVSARYQELGPETVRHFFPSDNTHTNWDGAKTIAALVAAYLETNQE